MGGRVRTARQPDGTWLQCAVLPGRVWFEVDAQAAGQGTRVLAWWAAAR